MWIQNVSLDDIVKGYHYDPGWNSMLIQIVDPDMDFPVPKYPFKEVHQFKFLDLEERDDYKQDYKISNTQAQSLITLLQRALDNDTNVVVHCVAGVCRSGAVAEVGVIIGFTDTHAYRSPNLMVKHKMLKALGMNYDPDEPYTMNGVPFEYDELNNKVILSEKNNDRN